MAESVSCDSRRARLPPGVHTIYRPARTKRRVYTVRDVQRIAGYAACENDTRQVVCGVLKGVGLYDDIQRARGEIGAYRELAKELLVDFDILGDDIRVLLAGLAEFLLGFLRIYRASRFVRWFFRRLLFLGGVLSAVEALLQALVLLEAADRTLREVGQRLDDISCIEDL
jgi:hypothetical protein